MVSMALLYRPLAGCRASARRMIKPSSLRRSRHSTGVRCSASDTALVKQEKLQLACPVCFEPFNYTSELDLCPIATSSVLFTCQCCKRSYTNNSKGIIDLTIPAKVAPLGTSFFQNPLMAFIYDRGYRDLFWLWNFPGFDEEFGMAQEMLKPAQGGILMDLSCAGGSFTKRFVASNNYKLVVAADYSVPMLEQCRGFLNKDIGADISKTVLLRADAGRLPFGKSSLAGVHAGAAIHCWPQPATAVAEIARVLRPGGVFVATTFFFSELPEPLEALACPARQAVMELQLPFKGWSDKELQQIVEGAGLVDWKCKTIGRFILFSAVKPR